MKIKRLIASLVMAVCMTAAAVCMTGCGTKYTVTLNRVGSDKNYTLSVGKGKTVDIDMFVEAYSEDFSLLTGLITDENFYTDEACRKKFVGGVYSDITLYFKSYSPLEYGRAIFEYKDEQYTVYRLKGTKLTAEDFSLSAYGRGTPSDYAFYSDKDCTVPLNIENSEVHQFPMNGEEVIYVADAD